MSTIAGIFFNGVAHLIWDHSIWPVPSMKAEKTEIAHKLTTLLIEMASDACSLENKVIKPKPKMYKTGKQALKTTL